MASGFAARCAERLRLSVIGTRYRPHSRRRKALPPAARMRRKRDAIGRKGAAFPHSRGAEPLKRRDLSLIWTALGFASHSKRGGEFIMASGGGSWPLRHQLPPWDFFTLRMTAP